MVPIAYAQTPSLNTNADVFSSTGGLMLGVSLNLYPYFVCIRATMTQASLRISAGSPEPSLLDNAILPKISLAGSIHT